MILVRICVGLVWASAGPLLPFLIGEFGLGKGAASWYASSAPVAIAALALPIGIIGARYSLKMLFAVGAFLQAAGVFAPLCFNYELILLTRIMFAIGTAFTVPIATAILAEWFSPRELPFVNGVTISFVSLGNTVAFVATVPLATVLSWRAPIALYGAFAFTCAVAWLVFGKERKKPKPPIPGSAGPIAQPPGPGLRHVLTQRSTLVLALSVMAAWCLSNAMGSWLPTYYHDVFNLPLSTASLITAIVTVTGILASISGGALSMRIGRRRPFLILSGLLMGGCAMLSILVNNIAVIIVGVALFGYFVNLQNAAIYTIPIELSRGSSRTGAVVFSLMLVGGNLGNFLGPLIVGYGADITDSYLPGFIICAVISLIVLVAGMLLPETGPAGNRPKDRTD